MKILFVGHDITYALFYASIEANFIESQHISTKHIYIRPSAWAYAKFILKINASSPSLMRVFSNIFSTKINPKEAIVDLSFYETNEISEIDRQKYFKLYNKYCIYLEKIFDAYSCDIAVLPGEFRLFEQALLTTLKTRKSSSKILYMEAGPPGYTYFDPEGVNANASFAITGNNPTTQLINNKSTPLTQTTSPLHQPSRNLFLILDILWLLVIKTFNDILDLKEYWVAFLNRLKRLKSVKNNNNKLNASNIDNSYERILFLGQVKNDVNNTHFGVSASILQQNLSELLHSDLNIHLIWRDHPLERLGSLFDYLNVNFPRRVLRGSNLLLKVELSTCQGVVTVNSNAGLEALESGIPVRLLGKSYYSSLPGVFTDNESFNAYRRQMKKYNLTSDIKFSAKQFLKNCFLPIDYRAEDFKNAHLAAEFILS